MAWKPLRTDALDIKTKPKEAVVGTFVDFTLIETQKGPQVIWNFINDKNVPFGVYGFTNLNNAMKKLRPGTRIQMTYMGKKFMPTKYNPKGQDVHQVDIQFDDESLKKLGPPLFPAKKAQLAPATGEHGFHEDGSPVQEAEEMPF